MKGMFQELCVASDGELERIFVVSRSPDLNRLAGWEWRGYNTPFFTSLLGIRKFVKGFFHGAGGLEGYNVPVRQNGLAAEWIQKPSPDSPHRFGFYRVAAVDSKARDNRYPAAALLDYGASSRNPAWRPERVLRDYLVQPDPSNPDVLLGKAYLALGPARIASNFFALERLRSTSWRP